MSLSAIKPLLQSLGINPLRIHSNFSLNLTVSCTQNYLLLGFEAYNNHNINNNNINDTNNNNNNTNNYTLIDRIEMEETAIAQVGLKIKRKRNRETVNYGGESEHEVHILTERERRKKMRNMFSSLHTLLPQLPVKADKSTIVDEAVNYIKTLQETLQTLERQRQEKLQGVDTEQPSVITSKTQALESRDAFLAIHEGPSSRFPMATNMHDSFPVSISPACFQTWFSPNVVMNMCGNDAQISVCSVKKPGLLTTIFYILDKHKLDVISAHISSDQFRCIYMIHVHAAGGPSGQYQEALSVEDKFKLAAGEINLWLLSC